MAALDDLIVVCVVGFVIIAAVSLMVTKTPAIPPFARRAPTSGNPQLHQDLNAGFLHDRGFLFRRRVWFVGTCCPPVPASMVPATASSRPLKDSTQFHRTVRCPRLVVVRGFFLLGVGSYSQRDVLTLIRDRQGRADQRLDRAHMLLNVDEGQNNGHIGNASPSPAKSAVPSSGTRQQLDASIAAAHSIFSMTASSRWPWAARPQSREPPAALR